MIVANGGVGARLQEQLHDLRAVISSFMQAVQPMRFLNPVFSQCQQLFHLVCIAVVRRLMDGVHLVVLARLQGWLTVPGVRCAVYGVAGCVCAISDEGRQRGAGTHAQQPSSQASTYTYTQTHLAL